MTTIIAMKCKDGIVMCADTQISNLKTGTRETIGKLKPIGNNALIGCSGVINYIDVFVDKLSESFELEGKCFDKIMCGIKNYSDFLNEYDVGKFTDYSMIFPEGIFAYYDTTDNKFRLFRLEPPAPPKEESVCNRIAIGSGGPYADNLLRTSEKLLQKIEKNWEMLSTKLVSQFIFLMMRELSQFDLFTGDTNNMYIITKNEIKTITLREIFNEDDNNKNLFSQFLENLMDEIPEIGTILLDLTNYKIITKLFSFLFKNPEQLMKVIASVGDSIDEYDDEDKQIRE